MEMEIKQKKTGLAGFLLNRYSVIFLALTLYLIIYRALWRVGFPDLYAAALGCAPIVPAILLTKSKLPMKKTGKKMTFVTFLVLLGLVFLGQTVAAPFNKLLERIFNGFGLSLYAATEVTQERELFNGLPAKLSNALWPIVLGPAVEELLYRVYAGGNIKNEGGKVLAIVTAAVAFSLAHGRVEYYLHTFLGGLVFGYIFFEFGFIWAAVFHVINNFGIVGLDLLLCTLLGDETGGTVDIIIGILFAVFAIVMVIVKRKEIAAFLKGNKAPAGEYRRAFLNIGFIVMVVYDLYKGISKIAPMK